MRLPTAWVRPHRPKLHCLAVLSQFAPRSALGTVHCIGFYRQRILRRPSFTPLTASEAMPLGLGSLTRAVCNRARRGLYAGRKVLSGNQISERGGNK